jgi:hypothetical protein
MLITESGLTLYSASRAAGFAEEFRGLAKPVSGGWSISPEAWRRLLLKYRLGLGTAVHAIAHPIAVVLDWTLGTDLQHCRSCEDRRIALNSIGSHDAP